MIVYALIRVYSDDQGEDCMGIYSTLNRASDAATTMLAPNGFRIYRVQVDGPPGWGPGELVRGVPRGGE